ncbi:MAG: prolipoprotein diacylglyceryl transferase [Candidatus Omnitrophota bacterium]
MMPRICTIGPFTIYSYGLLLVAAFVVAAFLAARRGRKDGFEPDEIFNFLFFVFIAGIIGCRILYVLDHWQFYLQNPLEIFMLQHGGMAWFGGLILGSAAGLFYLKRKGLPVLKFLDLIIPFVALGQAIGRIGCFLNGCCYGKVSEFGVYFPSLDEVRLPTQIYSSLLLLAIFIILRIFQDKPHKPGMVLAGYFLLYSLKRFVIEFFRGDSPHILLNLTLFQLLSIGLFLFSICMFIVLGFSKVEK